MPKAKSSKSSGQPPIIDRGAAGMRALAFFVIVLALTGMLVFVWMGLPKKQAPTPAPVDQTQAQKTACESDGGQWVACGQPACAPGQQCTKTCVAKCVKPNLPIPAPAPAPTSTVREAPLGMLCDDTNSICVDPSFADGVLPNPFVATGTGIAFENTMNYQLLDGNGTKLAEGFTTASAPDVGQPGDFQIRDFILAVPKTTTGTLQVFESSAKDGTPIHVVSIPVKLSQKTRSIILECEASDGPIDIPSANLPIEATVRSFMNHNDLSSVQLKGGILTVNLATDNISLDTKTCIEATVRASFSSVRSVVFVPKQ